jgi:hypothetical protein
VLRQGTANPFLVAIEKRVIYGPRFHLLLAPGEKTCRGFFLRKTAQYGNLFERRMAGAGFFNGVEMVASGWFF